ncbi:TonB-dependent siderophore receptor [Cupriavidus basilensis]|uniref:TonB-dependent siderophore receptor n=1 Tax=Cupriavidus basilensis TaxID=68895 RepID=A0ABT6AWE1_9BURK|nr:TonB-dependent siderophore receptor [Cupriavidus basilensis]MDF3836940.1 TonB-dependent siderophore receptor [Cupriavidus basilensis]
MNRRTPIATALFALFATPVVAVAQTAPAAAPASRGATTLQEVVVQGGSARDDYNAVKNSVSKLPEDLHDIAQSVTVVNKALIDAQGGTSLADALRNVPGITIGAAEGGQIGNNINLNGFSARTDIYLDGFRDRGQYYRDTFALDSVEVLMGPSSMLFGRGSTGGVINQVSKKPSLKAATEVSGSVTTNGMVRATADYNTPTGETSAFRIAAMAQDGAPTTRDQMTVQDFGLAPSWRLGIGTPTEITLSALVQHNEDMADYGFPAINGHPVNVNRKTSYGYNDDRTIQDVAALNATVDHKFSPNLRLRNQTQFNYVNTNARETAPNAVGTVSIKGFTPLTTTTLPLDALSVRLQSHDRHIRDYSIFNQTELTAKFDTGPVKHTVLVGAEIGHDGYDNQNYYRNGSCNGVALNAAATATAAAGTSGYVACEPLVAPTYSNSPTNAPSVAGNRQGASANTLAAYINDSVELSKQWKLVGGVRYDRYIASITNSVNSTNTLGNTSLASADQTVNFTSVRLGGIWQPTEAQSYYVSYGTSFNPSLEQLVATVGQQNLAPEKNKSYEVGGKWDLMGGDLSLTSAAFQITKDNARSQIDATTYALTGQIRVRGFRAGATGHITNKWQVFAGYTFLDAEIVNGIAAGTQGMTPVNTPKHTATAWTSYRVLPDWEVGGGAFYMSQRYANNTDTVQVGGYVRWDGMIAYHQPRYDVRLNLFNLLDKKYFDALIPSDGGRSVPGTGRTAMLSFVYRM